MNKSLMIAALAATAILAGCDKKEERAPASPVTSTAPPVTSVATPQSAPEIVSYTCDSGKTLTVEYFPENKATLKYEGSTHALAAASASSKRYLNDDIQWNRAAAGSKSTLSHMKAGTSGETIESCLEPASQH